MAEYIPIEGQLTGGPLLGKHCTINHEELVLDLRSASTGIAHIKANYFFSSDTAITSVQLVFIANNLLEKNFRILLDGQSITGDTASLDGFPAEWGVPDQIQAGNEIRYLQYEKHFINRSVLFTIPIAEGDHLLSVEYDALLTQYTTGPTISYELLYILSPVKSWKDYKGLDLKIALPGNWVMQSNLSMVKEGNSFHGNWNKLPENYVFIAVKLSDENADMYMSLYLFGLWGLIIALIAWRLIIATKNLVKGKNKPGFTWTLPLWVSVIWVILFYVIFFNRQNVIELIYGSEAGPDYTRGDVYAIMGIPFLWIFGVIGGYLVQSVAYVILREKKS